MKLDVYVDSDWGSSSDRKSTTGFVVFLNGGVIAFKSRKQKLIATSSAEAEFIASAECLKYTRGLLNTLQELKMSPKGKVSIYNDNQASIQLLNSNKVYSRSKNIDLKYLFSRHELTRGDCELKYVETNANIADGLTKPLTGKKFELFMSQVVS